MKRRLNDTFAWDPTNTADRLRVPESNPTSAIGQPVPASSRLAAALIDMAVVAVPTGVVAAVASERFPILDDSGPRPRFSDADQLRINQIDEGFNRAMRLGDTVFTLSGFGWWLTVLVLIALTAAVFVLVPSKLRRGTPGQRLLGLPTSDVPDERDQATLIMIESLEDAGLNAENPQNPSDWVVAETGQETKAEAAPTGSAEEPLDETAPADLATADEAPADNPVEGHDEPPVATEPITLGTPDDYLAWDRELAETPIGNEAEVERDQFTTLTLTESSLAESPLNASTTDTATTEASTTSAATTDTATTTAVTASASELTAEANQAPTAESPIWSDLWKAWLYWDPATDRWFRHDSDENRWKPLT